MPIKWNTNQGNAIIELIFVIPFVLLFLWGVQWLYQLSLKQQKEIIFSQTKEKRQWIQKQRYE